MPLTTLDLSCSSVSKTTKEDLVHRTATFKIDVEGRHHYMQAEDSDAADR